MIASEICTARLLLRPARMSDAAAIYASYANDPAVTRFLSWPVHRSINDTQSNLRMLAEMAADGTFAYWLITNRADGQILGSISIRAEDRSAILGYCIAQAAWGQGITSEAAAAILPLVWDEPEFDRLIAFVHPENSRSARVLEKLGMRYRGIARGSCNCPALGTSPQDMLRYRLDRPRGMPIKKPHMEYVRPENNVVGYDAKKEQLTT